MCTTSSRSSGCIAGPMRCERCADRVSWHERHVDTRWILRSIPRPGDGHDHGATGVARPKCSAEREAIVILVIEFVLIAIAVAALIGGARAGIAATRDDPCASRGSSTNDPIVIRRDVRAAEHRAGTQPDPAGGGRF